MPVAILDDYQDAALRFADWSAAKTKVKAFNEHIADRDKLAKALADFEIVVAMRERTPFDHKLFAKLPKLKLLVTTGMRNAAIDLEAASAHGVMVCGTDGSLHPTAELAWGLILACLRNIPLENAIAPWRPLAEQRRRRSQRQTARRHRPRPARFPRRPRRQGVRDERAGLEQAPDARALRSGRRRAGTLARRRAAHLGYRHHSSGIE
jgi:hypothetical protein